VTRHLSALVAWLALSVGGACAQVSSEAVSDHPFDRWRAFADPGPAHESLARFLGEWDTVTSVWLEPGGEPYSVSEGRAVHTWLEKGRWLALESAGDVVEIPHHGFGILGFDNFKKRHVATFVDNISTGMLYMEGGYTASGDVLQLFGRVDEPLTGEHDRAVRYEFRFAGPDSMMLVVHDVPRGEPDVVLEIAYHRRTAGTE